MTSTPARTSSRSMWATCGASSPRMEVPRASSRLLVGTLPGRRPISNEPELLSPTRPGAQVAVRREARELAETRSGYSSVTLAELGEIRLYREPLMRAGRAVAVVGVGEPL